MQPERRGNTASTQPVMGANDKEQGMNEAENSGKQADDGRVAKLRDGMLNLIASRRHVSFAELARLDGVAMAGDGGYAFQMDGKGIIFWVGMTMEACDAIGGLVRDGLVDMKPCEPLVYLIDGASLRFPLARHLRGYKKPHWMPVALNPTRKGESAFKSMRDRSKSA